MKSSLLQRSFSLSQSILSSSVSHPHKKHAFQERGEQRNINHHLENFHHVFSSWLLASLIGVYSFLWTSFIMESYAATTITVPSQVTNLRWVPYTWGVLLAWSQATSPSSTTPVTDYIIGYKLSTAKSYKLYSDGASTTPNTRVEPLISGNSYDFRVAAKNKKWIGSYSTALRITLPANATSIPSAPTGVTAIPKVDTNPTTDSATLSFITPRNNGGLPIQSYTITASPQATSTTSVKITKTISANSSLSTATAASLTKVTLTLTGLTNNTTYTFTVRATNTLGTSPESIPSSPITIGKTNPPTTTNTGNTNTGVTNNTSTSINTWTNISTNSWWTIPPSNGGWSPTQQNPPLSLLSGSCGTSNGQTFSTLPTSNLCTIGTPSSITQWSTNYTWSCLGQNGGTTASCSANKQSVNTPTIPNQTNANTNFFLDSWFESGMWGFEPNQSTTVVSTTRTNPISWSQSLVIWIWGYGDSVLWSGIDFSQYANKRSGLLSVSAHFRSTVSSISKASLCSLVNYTDGTSDMQCSEFNMSVWDKGTISVVAPLLSSKDLSQVRIGVFQVWSQVIAWLMMDDVQVNLAWLTFQDAPIPPLVPQSPTSPSPSNPSPNPPPVSSTGYNPAWTSQAPTGSLNGLRVDLTYVNQSSSEFLRFKSMVDAALAWDPDYGFEPQHAAYMYRITSDVRYCDYAIRFAENCAWSRYAEPNCWVEWAESAINTGNRPPVSGDSYLEVWPTISSLALVYDWCGSRLTASQKTRWQNYANQTIYNVWNPNSATWGGVSYPWSGWSIDNPWNNYYYSFVEATMYWALATKNQNMLAYVRTKLQWLVDYYRLIPGWGSLEWTGYGASHMRLFQIYQVWKDSTGEDLANSTSHMTDTIRFWLHATTPNRAYYAPIGDLARASFPDLFDYHRRIVLEARRLTTSTVAQDLASWWLSHISVNQMSRRIDSQWDLLPAWNNSNASPNESLAYHATGIGRIFARTSWDTNALWMTFVAGKYNESHAHQDQWSFDLANNSWLAVTNNIYTPSGIEQWTEYHNVLRFEQNGSIIPQREGTESIMTVNQLTPNGDADVTANLTRAYAGNQAVGNWTRNIKFSQRKLTVNDNFTLGSWTRAIFQIHTPVQPVINGNLITAWSLKIRVISPANPTISVVNLWRYRIDISGWTSLYTVELSDQ